MKFSMYSKFTDYVTNNGIENAAKYAVSLGLSGVEFLAITSRPTYCPIPNPKEAKAFKEVLDRYNLPVCCYSVSTNLWDEEGAEEAMMRQVEITAALGCKLLHHTLLPVLVLTDNMPTYDEVIDKVVDSAVRIANYAKTFGITCIYEDQGYYFNGVDQFKDFWGRITARCSNVGICADLGNILFVNQDAHDFLTFFAKDVRHVHVKDYISKKADACPGKFWRPCKDGYWLRETMVGSGAVNYELCIQLLKEAGYDGAFSLELTHPEPFEAGVEQSIEYITRLWSA